MKYPQLVSTRAVNAISDWLESRLEDLGVDSPLIYSRLLLSLLHTPLQLHAIDIAELATNEPPRRRSPPNQPQPPSSSRPLRNHRPDDHHFAGAIPLHESESAKRQAAIDSLVDVVADNQPADHVASLVDELCAKLREIESESGTEPTFFEVAPAAMKKNRAHMAPNGTTKNVPIEDPARCYYQAFPALSKSWDPEPSMTIATSAESWPPASFQNHHQHFDAADNHAAVPRNRNAANHLAKSSSLGGSHNSVDTAATKRTRSRRRRGGKAKSIAHNGTPGISSASGSGGIGRKSMWDTNLEGNWEMGRDLIREYVLNQKKVTERQEFVAPQREYCDGTKAQMQNLRARYERCEEPHHEDDRHRRLHRRPPLVVECLPPRRLYEREVSTESLNVATPTEEEEKAMYEAKFDRNIAALWSDTADVRPVAALPGQNVSFWANYNRHRYMAEPANQSPPNEALGGHTSAHYEVETDMPVQHESMQRLNFYEPNPAVVRDQEYVGQGSRSAYETGGDEMSFYANPWSTGTNESEAELKEKKMRDAFNGAIANQNVQPASAGGFSSLGTNQINVKPFNNHQLSFWSNWSTSNRAFGSGDAPQQVSTIATQSNLSINETHPNLSMNDDAIAANTKAAAAAAWSTTIDSSQPPSTAWPPTTSYGSPTTCYGPLTWSTQGTEPIISAATSLVASQNTHAARIGMANYMMSSQPQSQLFAPMNPNEAVNRYFPQPPIGTSHLNWTHGPAIVREETSNPTTSTSSVITLHNHSQSSGFTKVTSSASSSSNEANKPFAATQLAAAAKMGSGISSNMNNNIIGPVGVDNTAKQPQVPRVVRTPIISRDESLLPKPSTSDTTPAAPAAAESIPELEHTHFRPIKSSYFDGHTFDIPSKLNKVEYRRSPGGSTWVDQDKYMRWIPCEDSDDETGSESGAAGPYRPVARRGLAGVADGAQSEDFVVKFCVKQQNEKGCQTSAADLDEVDQPDMPTIRFGTADAFCQTVADRGNRLNETKKLVAGGRTDGDASVFAASTSAGPGGVSSGGVSVGMQMANDMDEWYRRSAAADCCVQGNAAHTLWEHCAVCGKRPEVASMPADREWLAELSADGDEIMSDLRYMQRLYIGNDWDGEEEEEEEEEENEEEGNLDYGDGDARGDDVRNLMKVELNKKSGGADGGRVYGLADGGGSTEGPNDIFYNVNKFISDLLRPERARDFAEQAAQRRNPFDEGIGRHGVANSPPQLVATDRYCGGLWNNADSVWRHDASPDGAKTGSVSSLWSSASTAPMVNMAAESACGSSAATGSASAGWEHSNLVQIWNDDATAVAMKPSPLASMSTASAGTSMTNSLSGTSSCAEDDSTDPVSGSDASKRCDRKRRHSASPNLVDLDEAVVGSVRSYAARKHTSMFGDEPDLTTIITCNYWTTATGNSTEDDCLAGGAQGLQEESNQIIDEMAGSSAAVILRNMAIRSARPLTR